MKTISTGKTITTNIVRNVCIAIGNSGDPGLIASLMPLLDDPAPVVRGMAVWALARLDGARFAKEKAARMEPETDPSVLAEWMTG